MAASGAEDVPPGTYELHIKITKAKDRARFVPSGREEEIGSLVREVIVPAGSEAFDLGTVVVPMKAGGLARKPPPVSLMLTIGWKGRESV